MAVFNTLRLEVKELKERDKTFFIELLSAPEIIDPIPQPKWTREEILKKFEEIIIYSDHPLTKEKVIWGVYEMGSTELIGLCAFLTNNDNQREIAYRFRKKYWGKGYGTEVTKNMIDYCFNELDLDVITADANIENIGSVKILEKFFLPLKVFFNEEENCTDRRYILKMENWLQ